MKPRPIGYWLLFGAVVSVLFFTTIAVGVIDGPQTMRERKFDAERVSRLASISFALDCYWQNEGNALPGSLQELKDWSESNDHEIVLNRYCMPGALQAPDRDEPFSYRAVSGPKYELCAVFHLPDRNSSDSVYRGGAFLPSNRFRRYEAGKTCFELTAQTPFWMPGGKI